MSMVTDAGAIAPKTLSPERLTSIDALRGFDMFWIVGGDHIARAFCRWLDTPLSQRLAEQFEHVRWEGFRFYDLIFPLFLFLVGVVLPFSLAKYQTGDQPKRAVLWRIARRVVLLFVLGLVCNNVLQFRFDSLRCTGVLQRIAICYGMAAVICLLTQVRTQAILFVAILLGYWAVLTYVPSPEAKAGDLTMEKSLAGYLDRHYLPGRINRNYYGYGDNEGLLSTIPAVATALLGVLAGRWLLSERASLDQVRRAVVSRAGLSGCGHDLGPGVPGHQDPLDEHVRSGSRGLELDLTCTVLHDHRRAQAPCLGVLFRGHRRQRNHHLCCRADHPLRRHCPILLRRCCPALGVLRLSDPATRHCRDRMAPAVLSVSKPDLSPCLSRGSAQSRPGGRIGVAPGKIAQLQLRAERTG